MSVKVSLTVIEGPDKGRTAEVTDALILGRGKDGLTFTDKKISGRHCQIIVEGNDVYIDDLNSTNGTFVGGRRISERQSLQNLDEIVVGLSKITVAIVEELSEFKQLNSPTPPSTEMPDQDPTRRAAVPPLAPPDPNAVYRETGIERINDLIQDELGGFSKWDHPATPAQSERPASSTAKVRVNLQMRRGPEGIPNFVCTKAVSYIGRKDVDIRINDLDCSRRHAAVEIVAGDKVFVRDLASTNGTYINGKRIAYQEVKTGDLIQIGQTIFEVSVESMS